MNRQTFVETIKVVYGSEPKNYTGATGHSDYVSLKNYDRAACVIQTGAWAGGTAAVTSTQATAVAGTGAKALSFAYQWTYASTGFTIDALTRTAVSSDTFNLAAANSVHVIEVEASDLDVANGFDCFRVSVASPGVNDDLYGIMIYLYGCRYPQATPPSAIVD
jgi:hypothetical protein